MHGRPCGHWLERVGGGGGSAAAAAAKLNTNANGMLIRGHKSIVCDVSFSAALPERPEHTHTHTHKS